MARAAMQNMMTIWKSRCMNLGLSVLMHSNCGVIEDWSGVMGGEENEQMGVTVGQDWVCFDVEEYG